MFRKLVDLMFAKVLAFSLVAAVAVISVAHAGSTVISFVLTINSLEQAIGEQGSVDLRATDIDGPLGTWTVDVQYEPETIEAVSCSPSKDSVCDLESSPDTVRVTGASADGLTSDTVLASITFECRSAGMSALALTSQNLSIPELTIDVTTMDGAVVCAEPNFSVGDVDCDGVVTSIDALLILQFHAGLMLSLPCPENADVNEDSRVDSIDAALILQHESCLICPLPRADPVALSHEGTLFNGDANCDARIDSLDALAVLQFDGGQLDELVYPPGGDSNGDGKIDSTDALLILQFDAGFMPDLYANACIMLFST